MVKFLHQVNLSVTTGDGQLNSRETNCPSWCTKHRLLLNNIMWHQILTFWMWIYNVLSPLWYKILYILYMLLTDKTLIESYDADYRIEIIRALRIKRPLIVTLSIILIFLSLELFVDFEGLNQKIFHLVSRSISSMSVAVFLSLIIGSDTPIIAYLYLIRMCGSNYLCSCGNTSKFNLCRKHLTGSMCCQVTFTWLIRSTEIIR